MKREYWSKDWIGTAKGGYYYRAFDLLEFIKKIEIEVGKVVGIAFEEEEHNLELVVEQELKPEVKSKAIQIFG